MSQTPEGKADYGRGRSPATTTALGRLARLFEEAGLDIADVGEVKTARLSVSAKGQVSGGITLHPSWEAGPAWPVVDRPAPVTVSVPKAKPKVPTSWRTAVILPDPQIGFRQLPDGTLDAFHDVRAIDIALQIVERLRPDLVVWLGDYLDLAPMGKYRQEPGFANTTQAAIDYGYQLMAKVAALAGEVRLIEGNHDLRLQTYIMDNAIAAYGLRRAMATPAEWPVLSVPYLLRLDELGVQYVGGYPSGATYINDNLACVHGHVVNSSGSTAARIVDDEQVSVIFGHVHRQETQFKTRNSRGRARTVVAHSPGTLARVDGAVPSVKSGLGPDGRPVRQFENWQQGLTVVSYEEGNGRFALDPVTIFTENGRTPWAMFRGGLLTHAEKG